LLPLHHGRGQPPGPVWRLVLHPRPHPAAWRAWVPRWMAWWQHPAAASVAVSAPHPLTHCTGRWVRPYGHLPQPPAAAAAAAAAAAGCRCAAPPALPGCRPPA
jgi:hypothetical protein